MGVLAKAVLLCLCATLTTAAAEQGGRLDVEALASIGAIVEGEIHAGNLPGAVVEIGHRGRIVYRQAFGNRTVAPAPQPMTADTGFDLASLTKAIATTTAVLQLVEAGRLRLDAAVAHYWPAFKANDKGPITVRQLLAHSSGLRPDLDMRADWSGYGAALKLIAAERPVAPAGSRVIYSDINFAVLGELVRRVSGLSLDVYCQRRIFEPLGMQDTRFRPTPALRQRVAPTGFRGGRLRQGEVHDPMARRMGGVAGHAGLFATADDLALFAQALLDAGMAHGERILRADTVARLGLPQLAGTPQLRGLGWRSEAPFAANRDELPPVGAISHFGYTGTALWIDPVSQTFVIVLSHRVHPDGRGDAEPLRRQIVAAVGAALGPLSWAQVSAAQPVLAPYASLRPLRREPLATGIDVLAGAGFAPLAGRRIGLITNHSGVDAAGRSSFDLLRRAPGVQLAALFTPEHGRSGELDTRIASATDAASGLPIYSLYGATLRPTPDMLAGLDALVFDVQDAGARFYTYITTMAYAMEAAAAQGIPFYVLDRPNPLGGEAVQGPLLDPELRSFTGYFPLPVRHGMTVGELARLFNAENRIGAQLEVVTMRGYRRGDWYDQTGRAWIAPSPNLRSLDAAILYPGVGIIEGARLSVGRGTATPFELVGAPWIDADALARALNARAIPGVRFEAASFTPADNRYRQQRCHGVRIHLLDRESLDAPLLGIELAHALHSLYPKNFQLDRILGSLGSRATLEAIRVGEDPRRVAAAWQDALLQFREVRAKHLLYRE